MALIEIKAIVKVFPVSMLISVIVRTAVMFVIKAGVAE